MPVLCSMLLATWPHSVSANSAHNSGQISRVIKLQPKLFLSCNVQKSDVYFACIHHLVYLDERAHGRSSKGPCVYSFPSRILFQSVLDSSSSWRIRLSSTSLPWFSVPSFLAHLIYRSFTAPLRLHRAAPTFRSFGPTTARISKRQLQPSIFRDLLRQLVIHLRSSAEIYRKLHDLGNIALTIMSTTPKPIHVFHLDTLTKK